MQFFNIIVIYLHFYSIYEYKQEGNKERQGETD